VLAFGPLASAFAAGNRAILKPSELTPRTSALLVDLIAQYLDTQMARQSHCCLFCKV
jgi:coniferyl-aldehyde dehydrogenase